MNWLTRARDLRQEMIVGMAALSDTLGALQGLMAQLASELRHVIAIQDQQGGKIGRFNTLLNEIVTVMVDWEARLNDPSRRMLLDGITGDLAGLSRIRLFFNFLATITAIQITREKSVELMSFVDDLKSMPEKIEVELVRARVGVENFRRAQEAMARDAGLGAAVLTRARDELATVAGTLVAEEEAARTASDGASRIAHRAMETAEAAVVRLVKAFQFSDSAAQRLEHVDTILAAATPGSGHAALAAAQLQALSEDLSDIVRELDDSLGSIGHMGRLVLEGFGPSHEQMRQMLASQSQIQGLFAEATDTARPAMERISTACEGLSTEIAEVLRRLEALDDIGQAISLAAVNARVKAAHAALAKQELGYIAMAVNESAAQAVETIAVAVRGMGQLRAQLDAMDYPGMSVKLSELTEVVDTIQATLAAAESREVEMSEAQQAITRALDGLEGVTRDSRSKLDELPRLAQAIGNVAAEIQREAGRFGDTTALAGLVPIYTMAREREVHALFTGAPVVAEVMTEDLDSILF